jgi:hypothetical protein
MSSTIELSQRHDSPSVLNADSGHEVADQEIDHQSERVVGISKARAVTIVGSVACVNLLNTMTSGILTVALPKIAKDLDIPPELLLWPASIYA